MPEIPRLSKRGGLSARLVLSILGGLGCSGEHSADDGRDAEANPSDACVLECGADGEVRRDAAPDAADSPTHHGGSDGGGAPFDAALEDAASNSDAGPKCSPFRSVPVRAKPPPTAHLAFERLTAAEPEL